MKLENVHSIHYLGNFVRIKSLCFIYHLVTLKYKGCPINKVVRK